MDSPSAASLDPTSFEAERKELETVLASGIFGPSSNAARLLRFVCEKHLEDAAATISEYEIATGALGRRSDFDAQRDSIVRVEAHRVRKRLQEYYDAEGASHAIKIVFARGHYAPRFVHPETPPEVLSAPVLTLPPPVQEVDAWALARRHRSGTLILAILLAAVLIAAAIKLYTARSASVAPALRALPALAGGDTVRILAGLESGEHVDRYGIRWSADQYFTGGTVNAVRYYSLALADDPGIYEHARTGESFSYDIPLRPGIYELRLMFAESAEVAIVGAVGDASRSFHVTANGVQILPPPDGHHMQQLDVVADAGGPNTADVKVIRDIQPAADGKLHLRFIGQNQRALLNAIEIVPGLKGKMKPLRWRANESPYTDHEGNLWLSDRYFRGGRLSRFHSVVSRSPDPALYEQERFGSFTYSVPVAAGSTYTVRLSFAENYFGGWAAAPRIPRIFSVYGNHAPLLRDFDLTREAGGAVTALTRTFRAVKPNSFDKIVLSFEPVTEFAIVNAISVEDEMKQP